MSNEYEKISSSELSRLANETIFKRMLLMTPISIFISFIFFDYAYLSHCFLFLLFHFFDLKKAGAFKKLDILIYVEKISFIIWIFFILSLFLQYISAPIVPIFAWVPLISISACLWVAVIRKEKGYV